ncbi:MAG TPA: glycosyltransferase 87 family protein [Streptosporangiaceae bacterium]
MAADVLADGRWLLAMGAALFAISLIALGRDVSHWATPDLMIYRHAGQTALRSGDLYTSSFGSARFTYPPFSALMFEVLSGPVTQVKWIMTGASVVALTVTGWVAAGELRGRPVVRAGTALVIAWAALWADPVMSTFTWGQIDLVLVAVTLADLCTREDRWWKGTGVGLAAGMKLTPVIFIPYLLLTRRYRAAATATVTFGLTVTVSFAVLPAQARQYWLGGLFLHQQRVGYPDMLPDQSLDGVLARLADPGSGSVWYAWLVAVVIVGTAGLMLAVLAHNRGLGLLGIVTCAITGLLISPSPGTIIGSGSSPSPSPPWPWSVRTTRRTGRRERSGPPASSSSARCSSTTRSSAARRCPDIAPLTG